MRALIPVVFFALAAWFALGSQAVPLPETSVAVVSVEDLSTDPLRLLPERLDVIRIGGVVQRCSDCHALFESAEVTPEVLKQHTDIVMDHGINTGCFNCHARGERNQLELYDGQTVAMELSEVLCAKCHGPTFRDWAAGMHGRSMGSWNRDDPEFQRLNCIECHDPHAPAVGGMAPLPGPNAWRAPAPEHHEVTPTWNPLRGAHLKNGSRKSAPNEEHR